ncbi:MAG TPA: LCP family protein [Candidatus Saccharimonadales bacterium]|nr:LCP family protein [Candidatus Saccharimonadales bacterium]
MQNQQPDGRQQAAQNKTPNLTPTQLLARDTPIDMSLPGEAVDAHSASLLRKAKLRKLRKVSTAATAVVLVLAITLGGLLLSQNYLRMHKVFRGSAPTAAALKLNMPDLLKGQDSGRVNILLLGRDGSNHKNADATSTIILASLDTLNDNATFISLPNNLWVNIPGGGVMQLGNAWENGEFKYLGKSLPGSTDTNAINAGYNMVDQAVNQVTGVGVDYNAIVNFQALSQTVDAVGGIPVNVAATLNDPSMAWQNGNNPIIASAGTQNMSGKQALLYVMSKQTTSDTARQLRQRQVLSALITKVFSLDTLGNPIKLSDLTTALGNNLETDMSLSDAGKLYTIFKAVGNNMASTDLSTLVTNGNMNGQPIVLPASGLFNYGAIQQYVALQLKDPFITKENAKILILNGTTVAGLATNLGNQLKLAGYDVLGEANTPTSGWATTKLYDLNKGDVRTKDALAKKLHLKTVNTAISKTIPTAGADFVIIIGNDEANNNQNQAN